jgi:cell division septation protein DedD
VNPPPAAHVSPESREKTKSPPVTKPAPAAKTPVQTAPFQPRYAVDAGSYTIRSNADRLISEIPGKYQPHTTITPVTVRGKLFYRVRIVVATKAEADELSAELLQKEKVHALILPLR